MGDGGRSVIRDSVGLVKQDDEWTVAEKVRTDELEEWRLEKQNGPGRDPRIGPVVRGPGGKRRRTLLEALEAVSPA
eukprot:11175929-Lingulodinium_polyedra.AAC.1